MLSKNVKDRVETIFDFSLYTMSLLVILAAYFRSGLRELSGSRLLESGKVYYYQYLLK